MALQTIRRILFRLRQTLFTGSRKVAKPKRPPDPRIDADPWLKVLFDEVGDRYQLGRELPDGLQILRRTGRERFNPMRVYLRSSSQEVAGDYDVRIRDQRTLDQARKLLDQKVTWRLTELGLHPARETVEEWGGTVITRRYQGACPDARIAAAAVRFICEQSDQILDTAAEE